MYISEALVQKHQRRGSKQTGKFSAMLQMFPPTVSSHECWSYLVPFSRYRRIKLENSLFSHPTLV